MGIRAKKVNKIKGVLSPLERLLKYRLYSKKWRKVNADRVKLYDAFRRAAFPEERSAYFKSWYVRNRERVRAKAKAYRDAHRGEENRRSTEWRKANPEKHRAQRARWRAKHRLSISSYNRKWKIENPEKVAGYGKKYQQTGKKLQSDLKYLTNHPQASIFRAFTPMHTLDAILADRDNLTPLDILMMKEEALAK